MFILMQPKAHHITKMILHRSEKRNALNQEMLEEMLAALKGLDPKTRVLILEGEGPCFCSGLDLHQMHQTSSSLLKEVLLTLYLLPIVTIASVHGAAIAGGAGLMSVCDIAVCSNATRISLPEVQRGLVPAIILAFLRRQIPERQLRELVLLGPDITPMQAKLIGWIHHIVNEVDRDTFVYHLAKGALLGGPEAIKRTKALFDDLQPRSIKEELLIAEQAHKLAKMSQEAKEGQEAFFEKREPVWYEDRSY